MRKIDVGTKENLEIRLNGCRDENFLSVYAEAKAICEQQGATIFFDDSPNMGYYMIDEFGRKPFIL